MKQSPSSLKPTKECFKCRKTKPLDEFYRHRMMADGHLNKCKECTKVDVSANYASRREQYSEYEQTRNQNPERRAAKAEYKRQHRKQHPEKYAARTAVSNAVRDGRLLKQPCQFCGNPNTQAHHEDYNKPLEVIWMCFKCHRERGHGQTVTVPDWKKK